MIVLHVSYFKFAARAIETHFHAASGFFSNRSIDLKQQYPRDIVPLNEDNFIYDNLCGALLPLPYRFSYALSMTGIKASPQREILPCHGLHISTTGNACVDIKAVLSQEATSVWFSFLIAELPRSEAPWVENLVIYFVRAYVRPFMF